MMIFKTCAASEYFTNMFVSTHNMSADRLMKQYRCVQYLPCPRKLALHFVLFGGNCAMLALSIKEIF
jgi:hypothetical protein